MTLMKGIKQGESWKVCNWVCKSQKWVENANQPQLKPIIWYTSWYFSRGGGKKKIRRASLANIKIFTPPYRILISAPEKNNKTLNTNFYVNIINYLRRFFFHKKSNKGKPQIYIPNWNCFFLNIKRQKIIIFLVFLPLEGILCRSLPESQQSQVF